MISSFKKDRLIRVFFASNAVTSIIILGLITLFLFKEGIEFFGQYRHELERYRKSGMEYASVITAQHDDLTILYRYLENILSKETEALESLNGGGLNETNNNDGTKALLALSRKFQNTKEHLLNYDCLLILILNLLPNAVNFLK